MKETSMGPLEVFHRYLEAVHTADLQLLGALISETVERSDYVGCTPDMSNWESLVHYVRETVIERRGRLTVVREVVDGDQVQALLEFRNDLIHDFGLERIVGTDIVRVRQGKIEAFRFIPKFDDDQTAEFFGRLGIGPRAGVTRAQHGPG